MDRLQKFYKGKHTAEPSRALALLSSIPTPSTQHSLPSFTHLCTALEAKMRRAFPVAAFGVSVQLWAVKYMNSQALHEPHSSVQYHMAFGFVCPVHLSHVFPIIAYTWMGFSCLPLEGTCCCSPFLDEAMDVHVIFIGVFYCPYFFTAHTTSLPSLPFQSAARYCLSVRSPHSPSFSVETGAPN